MLNATLIFPADQGRFGVIAIYAAAWSPTVRGASKRLGVFQIMC